MPPSGRGLVSTLPRCGRRAGAAATTCRLVFHRFTTPPPPPRCATLRTLWTGQPRSRGGDRPAAWAGGAHRGADSPFAWDRGSPDPDHVARAAIARLSSMNHFDVVRSLLPVLQKEFGETNAVGMYASLQALQRYQSTHRSSKVLPGTPAMPNTALDGGKVTAASHFMRFAAAAYGWKGVLFFHLTDPTASYGLDSMAGLFRSSLLGDAASFARFAGVPADHIVYESSEAQVGMPKHYVLIDEASKSVVLTIRGTMTLNDALTDLVARHVEFAGGEAHEGIAHGAHAIFAATLDILTGELTKRPGWNLVVTGHSLGAGSSILFTILLLHHRARLTADKRLPREHVPFHGVNISCFAFAPPPVFAPISALPDETVAAITSWVHNEDLVPRLTLEGVRDLVRILRKISEHEPSLGKRIFADVDIAAVLATEPEYLRSWDRQRTTDAATSTSAATGGHGPHPASREASAEERKRLRIPGTIYLFRAPVDVGASVAFKGFATPDGSPTPSPPPTTPEGGESGAVEGAGAVVTAPVTPPSGASDTPTTVAAMAEATGRVDVGGSNATAWWSQLHNPSGSGAPGVATGDQERVADGAAAGRSPPSPPPASSSPVLEALSGTILGAVRSVADVTATTLYDITGAVSSATVGMAHAVATGVTNVGSAITAAAGAGIGSSAAAASTPGLNDMELEAGVASEAASRAQTEALPFITVCEPDDLRNVPITNRAWRDHIPDMYLNALRQLKEIADRQAEAAAAARAGRPDLATPIHGSMLRHVPLGGGKFATLNPAAERTGEGKDDGSRGEEVDGAVAHRPSGGPGRPSSAEVRAAVVREESAARARIQAMEAREREALGEAGTEASMDAVGSGAGSGHGTGHDRAGSVGAGKD